MTYNDELTKEAYDLIRYLYKNMPTYNQLKGTYAGIQYILNLMGLCTSIIELWSPRTDEALKNFGTNNELYRADYLNAVRQRISEWGNATVKDYFLTSKFDVDFIQQKNITFEMFNGMSNTVIDTIMQMKPVSKCLRRLYYILKLNTNIHFEYASILDKDERILQDYYYAWTITHRPLSYKTELDIRARNIYTIFLPWDTDNTARGPDGFTLTNTYFKLNNLENKLKASQQKTFSFKLIGWLRSNPSVTHIVNYTLEIGKDVEIKTEDNGILLSFNGIAANMLTDIFGDEVLSINDIELVLSTSFSIAVGSNFIRQN